MAADLADTIPYSVKVYLGSENTEPIESFEYRGIAGPAIEEGAYIERPEIKAVIDQYQDEYPEKEIIGIERASSREVRKGFEGSIKYQEISHGNDESIKSNSSSSRENRQTELEGQSKTICNSNGNNARSNIDNSRSIPVNKPNKVRDWDMER